MNKFVKALDSLDYFGRFMFEVLNPGEAMLDRSLRETSLKETRMRLNTWSTENIEYFLDGMRSISPNCLENLPSEQKPQNVEEIFVEILCQRYRERGLGWENYWSGEKERKKMER